MRLNNTLCGWLLILFGAAIVAYSSTFPSALGQPIGPALVPNLLGGGIAVSGIILLWSGRRSPSGPLIGWGRWTGHPRMILNGAVVIGDLVFYALAVDTMGFFITSLIFLTALFVAFEVSWRWIAPLAAGTTVLLHFSFYSLLHVPLPWGWLEGIAW